MHDFESSWSVESQADNMESLHLNIKKEIKLAWGLGNKRMPFLLSVLLTMVLHLKNISSMEIVYVAYKFRIMWDERILDFRKIWNDPFITCFT